MNVAMKNNLLTGANYTSGLIFFLEGPMPVVKEPVHRAQKYLTAHPKQKFGSALKPPPSRRGRREMERRQKQILSKFLKDNGVEL